jgi:serine/threonine protein kinase/tetratricopeptide (TPR) repeat protein
MPVWSPQANAIFMQALEQASADERRAYIERACAGNAELRGQVEALLAADARAGSFLESPPVELEETGEEGGEGKAGPEEVGTQIGPYRLVQKLGEGGMGAVWVAEQREPVKRQVALKVIKPGMDSAQVVRRFEAERQALALMDHTHIAKVFDAGTTAQGRPYFVMELVKGVPITQYCDGLNLPVCERLELFVSVCQAIQHAHQKGVIHRDIKPSNVLVCVQDGRPVAKVIDFGVAKATGPKLTDSSLSTELGAVIGTLDYMSPEQAELSALDVDTRADVYALGVLLYELLTGTTPLDRKRRKEVGLVEALRLIREEAPRPSTRLSNSGDLLASVSVQRRMEPGRLMRMVRGELDWIVMKCLEKDRRRRYETASALAGDVARYLADEAVEACPPSASYRLGKFARRHRTGLAVALGCVLVLAAGAAVSAWQAFRATRAEANALSERDDKEKARAAEEGERVRAEKAEALAREEASIATAVSDFLQADLLRQADSMMQANAGFEAEPNLTVKEALDRAAAQIGRRFRKQPLVEAAIRMAIGNAYRGVGEARLAAPHLARSWALRKERLGADHPLTLLSMGDLAAAYRASGELDRALPLAERSVAKCRKQLGRDHPDTLSSMNNLGLTYRDAGRYKEALALLEQTLAGRARVLGRGHLHTLQSMGNLAVAYNDARRPGKALPLFEQGLAMGRKRWGADHPITITSMNNLAQAYQAERQFAKAHALLRQAEAKCRAKFGPDHPNTLGTSIGLAAAYRAAGQLDRALPLAEKTLARVKEKLGPDHPLTLIGLTHLAQTYQAARKLDRAVPLFEEALAKRRERLGPDHPKTLISMHHLAVAQRAAGRLDRELPLLERVTPKLKEKLGGDHPITCISMQDLGAAYRRAGQAARGVPLLEEALKGMKASLVPEHRHTLTCMGNLARAYQGAGKFDKALPLLEETLARRKKTLGPYHAETLGTMDNLGTAYLAAKQPDKAVAHFDAFLAGLKKVHGSEQPRLAAIQSSIALDLLRANQPAAAEPLLRESLAIRAKKQPDDWGTFAIRSLLGEALLRQKKYPAAEPLLKAGYEGLKAREDKIPPKIRKLRLAEALVRLVRPAEAACREEDAAKWRKELEAMKPPKGK